MITLNSKIPTRWWDNELNFGDLIGPWLVEKITGKEAVWVDKKKPHYLIVGSILGRVSPSSIVWGIGSFGSEQKGNIETNATYLAVRGPLTRSKLQMQGIECPRVYGDPALLVPDYYHPYVKKQYEVGVVLRWSEKKRKKELEKIPGILIIDLLTDDIEGVLDKFLSCKKIVSTSLHGLIIADAYGIPNAWVIAQTGAGKEFKFWDYLISVNKCRKPIEVDFNSQTVDQDFLLNELPYDGRPIDIDLDLLRSACPLKQSRQLASEAEDKSLANSSVSGMTELLNFKWLTDTVLELEGVTMPSSGLIKGGHSVLNVWFESEKGRFVYPKSLSPRDFSHFPLKLKQNSQINLSHCGFSAIFDFSDVLESSPSHFESFVFNVEINSELGALASKATHRSSFGSINKMYASSYIGERLITPEWSKDGLNVFFRKPSVEVIDFSLVDGMLKVLAFPTKNFSPLTATLRSHEVNKSIDPVRFLESKGTVEAVFDITNIMSVDHCSEPSFFVSFSSDKANRIAHVSTDKVDPFDPFFHDGVEIFRTQRGVFRVRRKEKKASSLVAEEIFLIESSDTPKIGLICTGEASKAYSSPTLQGNRESSVIGTIDRLGGTRYILCFDLSPAEEPFLFQRVKDIISSGTYSFCVDCDGAEEVVNASRFAKKLPITLSSKLANMVVFSGDEGRLQTKISKPLNYFEVGEGNQYKLSKKFSDAPLIDAFYFESWFGKNVSDNPLGIINGLVSRGDNIPIYVGVQDFSVEVPSGTTPLLIGSEDWWYSISSCRYVVNNSWFSNLLVKKKGQKWIQTWHGTPLKKLGIDRDDVVRSEKYAAKSSNQWDLLVSQNPYSTEIFRRAYKYAGDVVECGYPRNDILSDKKKCSELRKRVRKYFGVDENKKVILYAPTWREYDRAKAGLLDVPCLLNFLDNDYIVFVRGHSITLASGSNIIGERIVDVTDFPDLAPLIASSDMLITDYSSLMFDYSLSGKPILFYCPDWDEYSGPGRGVYFDLRDKAPGPFLTSEKEVANSVINIDDVKKKFAGKYKDWNMEFNPCGSGSATSEILKHLL